MAWVFGSDSDVPRKQRFHHCYRRFSKKRRFSCNKSTFWMKINFNSLYEMNMIQFYFFNRTSTTFHAPKWVYIFEDKFVRHIKRITLLKEKTKIPSSFHEKNDLNIMKIYIFFTNQTLFLIFKITYWPFVKINPNWVLKA